MAKTPSVMLPLGTPAPPWRLPDARGREVAAEDFATAPALLVMFVCNHCPYVKHVRQALVALARDYQARGVAIVAINSNDARQYPEDAPAHMLEEIDANGYTFPYLVDATQDVARAFHAACTPDFFLFDRARRLVYRGQLDDSRPSNGLPVTGADLRRALDATLAGTEVPGDQRPSVGCNIKWRPGCEPDYVARR